MRTHAEKKESVYDLHNAGSGSNSKNYFVDNRAKSAVQRKQMDALNNSGASKTPVQKVANNTGLPDQLKSGIENISGHSMDDVKVHYNSAKPAQLNAHAYAQGTDIHIATGQEKHLPHEAWHVVQQKQGRVKPTMQMKGKVNVNDDKGLEKEADVMGSKAAKLSVDKQVTQYKQSSNSFGKPVQRALTELSDPAYKGETRNENVILRDDGQGWYTEMNSDTELFYHPNTDQYTVGEGNYWDPVTTTELVPRGHNVYDSLDGNTHYNYVRGRYVVAVEGANVAAEPALDGALTTFINAIWGARTILNAIHTPRERLKYIYNHFYSHGGGSKVAPAHSTPLIETMVGIANSRGGEIQGGAKIPLGGTAFEDTRSPARLLHYLRTGNEGQRKVAYDKLAGAYYYFRLGTAAPNRRIIINTAPANTPAEFVKVYNIVNAYQDVAVDIKVGGPLAAAQKQDSMVMYVNGNAGRFQTMVDALVGGGIVTVDELPAMIRGLGAGIGYAHDPAPVKGVNISFGEKRVILAYMAFEKSSSLEQFTYLAGQFFEDAGIVAARAHTEKAAHGTTVINHLSAYLTLWRTKP